MLAEALPTVSPDGLTYTIKLRQGIKFHNGKEMTSDDVVPSLKRWRQQAVRAKASAQVADVKAAGPATVELKLKEKVAAVVVISLATPNNFGAIYPKEIAEKFPPAEKATEFIGTGPTSSPSGSRTSTSGWSASTTTSRGARRPTATAARRPSGSTRSAGSRCPTSPPASPRWRPASLTSPTTSTSTRSTACRGAPNARPVVAKPYYWLVAVLNKKEGLMTNQKLRQAWQAAIDIEPIMKAVRVGGPSSIGWTRASPSSENAPWYVKAQAAWGWNERNKDKAKRLMKEAGYKGEPIRFVTTQEYKWMYDFALVTKQQLEDVGFNIDLQVVDWATLVKRRNNPKEYEAFTTGTGNIFEPTAFTVLSCTWPGWTCDEEIQALLQELARETDQKKRFALWEQMHRLWYEKVPSIRYGDLHGLRGGVEEAPGLQREDRAAAVLQRLARALSQSGPRDPLDEATAPLTAGGFPRAEAMPPGRGGRSAGSAPQPRHSERWSA